jgi:hypothetical protein
MAMMRGGCQGKTAIIASGGETTAIGRDFP